MRRLDADVAAERHDVRRRHRHQDAAAEAREADQGLRRIGMQAGDARPAVPSGNVV